ncbi:MAG: hypothetical protein P8M30_00995, partial [Planctomycetaceae bacterium]|nr:hypothetical protein [Planctomycetaceae bacterium]
MNPKTAFLHRQRNDFPMTTKIRNPNLHVLRTSAARLFIPFLHTLPLLLAGFGLAGAVNAAEPFEAFLEKH